MIHSKKIKVVTSKYNASTHGKHFSKPITTPKSGLIYRAKVFMVWATVDRLSGIIF